MALSRYLAFSILALSILSYGLSSTAFSQLTEEEQALFEKLGCDPDTQVVVNNECVAAVDLLASLNPNVALQTDKTLYAQGNLVTITGKINQTDTLLNPAITIRVLNVDNNIIAVDQFMPNSDGTFSTQVLADGPLWKVKGKYKVIANYGAQKSEIFFDFTGGTGETAPPPPPPKCKENEVLVDGECVLKEPKPITCNPGFVLKDGKCVVEEKPTPEPTPEPEPEPEPTPICGEGTVLKDGKCVVAEPPKPEPAPGGGCLIATAAYGTELAPQVQFLREIRDNTVLSTGSGTAFMTTFNDLYYSFSPTIADWERENPVFRDGVRTFITPMIASLSIMTLADPGSEAEVLGFGISVIMLNLGLYIAAPAVTVYQVRKRLGRK